MATITDAASNLVATHKALVDAFDPSRNANMPMNEDRAKALIAAYLDALDAAASAVGRAAP